MLGSLKQHLSKLNKPSVLTIIVAVTFGLAFVFYTPLLWGADETTQFGRAYQISSGHILPQKFMKSYGGQIPKNALRLIDYVNNDLNINKKSVVPGAISVDNPKGYSQLGALPLKGKKVNYSFSNTAPYSPAAYLPAAIGLKFAEIFNLNLGPAIYSARIAGLIVFIAAVGWAMWTLRSTKAKWMVFAVAFVPMVIYQASIISADSFTNTLSILLVALIIKGIFSREKYTKIDIVLVVLCCLLLPVVKPSYLLLPLLVVPLCLTSRSLVEDNARRFVVILSIIFGLALFAVWQYMTRSLVNAPKLEIIGLVPWWNSVDPQAQLRHILESPFGYIKVLIKTLTLYDNRYFDGLFGWLGFGAMQVPATAIAASFSSLLLSIVGAEKVPKKSRKSFIAMVVVVFVSLMALFGTFYLTISRVGMSTIEGVQGRYFIPLLLPFIMLLAYATNSKIDLSISKSYKKFEILICVLVLLSLVTSLAKYTYFTWT